MLSQSVFYQVLNAVSDRVFEENIEWRSNILFKEETERTLLLQVKGLIQIICARFYHPLDILLRGTKYWAPKNWKFTFFWRKTNWYVLQIAKAHLYDLVHDFWKKYHEADVSSLWWCTHVYTKIFRKQGIQKMCTRISNSLKLHVYLWFIEIWTIILTEGRNFKAFWKENYAIALDSCCLFAEKMLNMELSMILIVLVELACIRHSRTLRQVWWIPCNLSRWWIWHSINL